MLASGGALAAPLVNRGSFRLFAGTDDSYSTRVIDLVAGATVVDMLGLLTLDWQKLRAWQHQPNAFNVDEFRRLRSSGVNVFHPAVDPASQDPHAEALAWASDWHGLFRSYPRYFLRVDDATDLDRPRRDSQIGILLGLQNSDHFRTVADVKTFHRLGQRVSQLTYSERNALGSGCEDTVDEGLTDYGRAIVGEMNRVGMAIDVSHCSDRSSVEAMGLSKRPVLVTHSNCRALVSHPRCKPDSVIKLLARHGGVMGITSVRAFVHGGASASLDDLLDHYQHVAKVAGIEHVGIGSDCDLGGSQERPAYAIRGLDHPRHVFDLTAGLLRRGFDEDDIRLVLGGNFQRALTEIWRPAAA
jgi:membrane dipeptidase